MMKKKHTEKLKEFLKAAIISSEQSDSPENTNSNKSLNWRKILQEYLNNNQLIPNDNLSHPSKLFYVLDNSGKISPEMIEEFLKAGLELRNNNLASTTSLSCDPIRNFIGQVTKIRDEANNPKSSSDNTNKPQ